VTILCISQCVFILFVTFIGHKSLLTTVCAGMMRHEDESLHYYVDGVDQGAACDGVPPHVYAVVDLYGQCAQVSIIQPDRGRDNMAHMAGALSENSSQPISLQQANMNSHPNLETSHRYNSIPYWSCSSSVIGWLAGLLTDRLTD
jgi:hypothetical protein